MGIVILKWIIVLLCFLNSAYMLIDGCQALITGDYIRPESGEYAGQLGPWAALFQKAGVDPMSRIMMSAFVVFGLAGLIINYAFLRNRKWSWNGILVYNILVSWYLVMGTISSLLQITLLLLMRYRVRHRRRC
jgi:hypothetical protein